jgi:predicted nucleic acid-binding protein
MSSRIFVDTNVFIYARDNRFPQKQVVARNWLAQITARELVVVSPQVIGELHNVASKGKLRASEAASHLSTTALEVWSTGQTDLDLLTLAWDVRQRTGFQWWDCVILAAAITADCRYLLSEDYQHDRTVDGVTIISPFKTSPADVLPPH